MIGDWPERCCWSKKIGMKTAFAVYGDTFGTKNSGADWDVEDISELVTIIKKIIILNNFYPGVDIVDVDQ